MAAGQTSPLGEMAKRAEEGTQLGGGLLGFLVCHEVTAPAWGIRVPQVGAQPLDEAPGVAHIGRLAAQGDCRRHGDARNRLVQLSL
jgi:hypothetical protein